MNDFEKEAKALLQNVALLSAFSTVYHNAVEALVTVDANDTVAVLRLQAKAQVIEEVRSELEAAMLRSDPTNGEPSRTIA